MSLTPGISWLWVGIYLGFEASTQRAVQGWFDLQDTSGRCSQRSNNSKSMPWPEPKKEEKLLIAGEPRIVQRQGVLQS